MNRPACTDAPPRFQPIREIVCSRHANGPPAIGFKKRRGRDSNPRYGYPQTAFRMRLLQPLGHLSRSDRALCCGLRSPATHRAASAPARDALRPHVCGSANKNRGFDQRAAADPRRGDGLDSRRSARPVIAAAIYPTRPIALSYDGHELENSVACESQSSSSQAPTAKSVTA